jgi:hypothetical protein
MKRGYDEINKKIKDGDAVVLTAEEAIEVVELKALRRPPRKSTWSPPGPSARCAPRALSSTRPFRAPIKMARCG